MKKVTFVENNILVNGVQVGRLDGTKEVYVELKNAEGEFEVVARFKYMSPKANAKHWLKFILAVMTTEEILKALRPTPGAWPSETPLGLAEKRGYVSLNSLKAKNA